MKKFLIIFFLILLIIPFSVESISATDYIVDDILSGIGWSMGISIEGDNIFLADGIVNQVLIFDKSENILLEKITLKENTCTGHIHGMEVTRDRIYVVKQDQCISIFDLNGEFLYEFGKKGNKQGEFNGLQNLEIFQKNIFVTDTGNNRIQVFDLNGEFLYEFGKKGNKQGEFNGLQNLEIFQKNIFVTDTGNNRIQVFDLNGEFLYEFGKKGNKQGEFNGLLGLKINNEQVFISEGSPNNRIQVFDLNGEFMGVINEDFNSPHQIYLTEKKLYVLDTYNYHVKIFSINNQFKINQNIDEIDNIFLSIIIISIIISFIFFLKKKSI